jgi:hypothetical protein
MKLIDVDSKATLEVFLTLKKRLNLYSFYGNVMKQISGIRQRCRDVSFKKPVRWQWKKWATIDSSLESLTLIKKIIYTTFPFF